MTLRGKVALITGGTQGIGKATLLRFAQDGARVAFCARGEEIGKRLEKEIGEKNQEAIFFPLDIACEKDVLKMIEVLDKRWGKIDILLNNAGFLGPMSSIENYPGADWEEVIRINVNGTFFVSRSVLAVMKRRNQGQMVFITSSVGRKGRALWGGYAVSKFAMEGLMQTIADETTGTGIRVMALNPSGTRTAMRAAAYPKEDPQTVKDPSEVADVLRYLVYQDWSVYHGRSVDFSAIWSEMNEKGER